MRAIRPAGAPAPSYPRLRSAWRILLGAAPLLVAEGRALADTTAPPSHGKQPCPKQPKPPKQDQSKDAPSRRRPDETPPPLPGGPARVFPTGAPGLVPASAPRPLVLQLHPHGPDEPCFTAGSDEELA